MRLLLQTTRVAPEGHGLGPICRALDCRAYVNGGNCARRKAIGYFSIIPSILWSLSSGHPASARGTEATQAGDWSMPASNADLNAPKFVRTSGGTLIQEISPGDDSERPVIRGDTVLVDYVLRRANGYFIYSTVEAVSFQPSDVPTGPVLWQLNDNKLLPGLVEGLIGLKKGGKRRLLVPPSAGYLAAPDAQPLMPTFGTSRQLQNHKSEPLIVEVQLRRII
eukprot:jgi/Picsp_1/4/NSC_00004-R1_fkbp-type peptidyl-prolyl cis-trans isomerase